MLPAFLMNNGPLSYTRQKCTYKSVSSFHIRLTLRTFKEVKEGEKKNHLYDL